MTYLARLIWFAIAACAIGPAFAADPTFPPGSRIGVVPIEGLVPAKGFSGFVTSDNGVKVLIAELPAAAYSEVENAFKSGSTGNISPESIETGVGKAYYTAENAKEGTNDVRRYTMIVSGGTFSGYLAVQVTKSAEETYSDDKIRQMFASVATRKDVPVAEQLDLLPFKVGDLGSFKTVRTLAPGVAILLADGDENAGIEAASYMIVGALASVPTQPDDRGRFAQQAAASIPGLRETKLTMSEPIRIDGAPGYETRLEAVSGKDNTPVTVVQWMRFSGAGGVLRIIASAPTSDWATAFPRFRAVRDGIQPR